MADTPRQPPYEALPNIQVLDRDVQAIKATLAPNNAAYTALESAAPPGRRQFWMLTVDLLRRIMEYAEAANLLLAWGAVVPFFPVLHALYESLTTLTYLSNHPSREFEAQVACAHEYYRTHRRWVDRGVTRTSALATTP